MKVKTACRLFFITGLVGSTNLLSADIAFELPQKSNFDSLLEVAQDFQVELEQKLNKNREQSSFIIGGRKADTHEFPSVVALIDESGEAFCTGNFIAPDIIATAGHCLFDASYKQSQVLKRFQALTQQSDSNKAEQFADNFKQFYQQYEQQLTTKIHLRIKDKNYFNLVEQVGVADSWKTFSLDMMRHQLFDTNEFTISSIAVSDRALIKINKAFSDLAIPLLPSKNEVMDVHKGDFKQAVQVGYGLRADPEQLKQSSSTQKEWKVKMAAAMNEKYLVELPINIVYQGAEGYRAGVGKPGRAACFGDSGGPTFVQLNDGQWRFFASLSRGVSVNVGCGESDASIWPDSASEQARQTTEFVDVWLRDEN